MKKEAEQASDEDRIKILTEGFGNFIQEVLAEDQQVIVISHGNAGLYILGSDEEPANIYAALTYAAEQALGRLQAKAFGVDLEEEDDDVTKH